MRKDQACDVDSRVQDRIECVDVGKQESHGWRWFEVCDITQWVLWYVQQFVLWSAFFSKVFVSLVVVFECVLPVGDALGG